MDVQPLASVRANEHPNSPGCIFINKIDVPPSILIPLENQRQVRTSADASTDHKHDNESSRNCIVDISSTAYILHARHMQYGDGDICVCNVVTLSVDKLHSVLQNIQYF
jgi:hypothetical protein